MKTSRLSKLIWVKRVLTSHHPTESAVDEGTAAPFSYTTSASCSVGAFSPYTAGSLYESLAAENANAAEKVRLSPEKNAVGAETGAAMVARCCTADIQS